MRVNNPKIIGSYNRISDENEVLHQLVTVDQVQAMIETALGMNIPSSTMVPLYSLRKDPNTKYLYIDQNGIGVSGIIDEINFVVNNNNNILTHSNFDSYLQFHGPLYKDEAGEGSNFAVRLLISNLPETQKYLFYYYDDHSFDSDYNGRTSLALSGIDDAIEASKNEILTGKINPLSGIVVELENFKHNIMDSVDFSINVEGGLFTVEQASKVRNGLTFRNNIEDDETFSYYYDGSNRFDVEPGSGIMFDFPSETIINISIKRDNNSDPYLYIDSNNGIGLSGINEAISSITNYVTSVSSTLNNKFNDYPTTSFVNSHISAATEDIIKFYIGGDGIYGGKLWEQTTFPETDEEPEGYWIAMHTVYDDIISIKNSMIKDISDHPDYAIPLYSSDSLSLSASNCVIGYSFHLKDPDYYDVEKEITFIDKVYDQDSAQSHGAQIYHFIPVEAAIISYVKEYVSAYFSINVLANNYATNMDLSTTSSTLNTKFNDYALLSTVTSVSSTLNDKFNDYATNSSVILSISSAISGVPTIEWNGDSMIGESDTQYEKWSEALVHQQESAPLGLIALLKPNDSPDKATISDVGITVRGTDGYHNIKLSKNNASLFAAVNNSLVIASTETLATEHNVAIFVNDIFNKFIGREIWHTNDDGHIIDENENILINGDLDCQLPPPSATIIDEISGLQNAISNTIAIQPFQFTSNQMTKVGEPVIRELTLSGNVINISYQKFSFDIPGYGFEVVDTDTNKLVITDMEHLANGDTRIYADLPWDETDERVIFSFSMQGETLIKNLGIYTFKVSAFVKENGQKINIKPIIIY